MGFGLQYSLHNANKPQCVSDGWPAGTDLSTFIFMLDGVFKCQLCYIYSYV